MNAINNWGKVLVSLLVTGGFITITYIYLTQKMNGQPSPEILSILLGALATNFTSVVGYWIGSSAGSAMKDQILNAPPSGPGARP